MGKQSVSFGPAWPGKAQGAPGWFLQVFWGPEVAWWEDDLGTPAVAKSLGYPSDTGKRQAQVPAAGPLFLPQVVLKKVPEPTGSLQEHYNNLCTKKSHKMNTFISYIPRSGWRHWKGIGRNHVKHGWYRPTSVGRVTGQGVWSLSRCGVRALGQWLEC